MKYANTSSMAFALMCVLNAMAQNPQLLTTGTGPIHALIEYNDSLFCGGSFNSFDGSTTYYSFTFDGIGFDQHDQLLGGSGFRDFTVINDTLWGVGTELTSANLGLNSHVNSIAYRDSGRWKGHNKYSVNNVKEVLALTSLQGDLIFGGNFTVLYPFVAMHNGNNFAPLGAGFNQGVNGLAVYNGELYAAGVMTMSGATALSNVAKWNGTAWEDVGGGTDFNVFCVEVWNGELYVAGSFTTAGGMPALRIARWDGSSWQAVAGGVSSPMNNPAYVRELRATPNGLLIGGRFEEVDGQAGSNLAIWDGTTLSPYGNLSLSDEVHAIGVYQGEVYFSTMSFGVGAIGKLFGPGTVGVEGISVDSEFTVYPNPASEIIQLQNAPVYGSYQVLDLAGRLILNGSVSNEIDVSGLNQGTYRIDLYEQGKSVGGMVFQVY